MALICLYILSLCIVNDKERRGEVLIQVAEVVYLFQPQLLTHQTLFVLYSVCIKRVIFVITHNIKNTGPSWHIHIFATSQHLPSGLYVCLYSTQLPSVALEFMHGNFWNKTKKICIQCCILFVFVNN